jgi:hypothetical protein
MGLAGHLPGGGRALNSTPRADTRRSERRPHKIEITLLGKSEGVEFQEPAHTFNVSDHGLGIRTDDPVDPSRTMNPGQIVYVYGVGNFRLGYCRVIWVRTDNPNLPSQAGLEFLN